MTLETRWLRFWCWLLGCDVTMRRDAFERYARGEMKLSEVTYCRRCGR